jgi:hypothetical protein
MRIRRANQAYQGSLERYCQVHCGGIMAEHHIGQPDHGGQLPQARAARKADRFGPAGTCNLLAKTDFARTAQKQAPRVPIDLQFVDRLGEALRQPYFRFPASPWDNCHDPGLIGKPHTPEKRLRFPTDRLGQGQVEPDGHVAKAE